MDNTSGIKPINLNVLVLPDPVEEKRGSILLSDETKEKMKWAQVKGTIVALCSDAFSEMAEPPEPGARVIYARHNGNAVMGDDGVEYRLLKDVDVTGLLA